MCKIAQISEKLGLIHENKGVESDRYIEVSKQVHEKEMDSVKTPQTHQISNTEEREDVDSGK